MDNEQSEAVIPAASPFGELVVCIQVAARTTPQRIFFRARIILLASTGASNRHIAHQVPTSRPTVILWRQRFGAGGLAALTEDAPGRGRRPQLPRTKVQQIVDATLHTTPPAATRRSTRTMAQAQHVSPATIQRIWDAPFPSCDG